ncbi:chemotaxis protein CheA [Pseudoduganella namucuonensis]|uniref:Chemotaxis protein CheA n=1 Tax=Pseudoduganella namucuonensis TaxID=1035707 RepID=A0A1I7LMD8_9BURK|nr:chemotaxis protein CheA [Pseudoduganella namucuonensis]SFV10882.1 two-component system, chemotaxis family, sensor kinase CheA [Pseudoduganella namucuonensis]
MDLDLALQTFILESRELLEDMENALLNAEQAGGSDDAVHAIFRAAHTIKGSAGLFSLDHIVAFTHVVESLLDDVRDGKLALTDELIVLLLSCCDHLSGMIAALEAGQTEADDEMLAAGAPLLTQLRAQMGVTEEPGHGGGASALVAGAAHPGVERIGEPGNHHDAWHLSLRFGPDVLRDGMDPLSFIRYLGQIGRVVGIVTLADKLPPAEQMDPETCYLGFEIALETEADKTAIEGVFEFVQDSCTLRILPPRSRLDDYLRVIEELPEQKSLLGEILVRCGCITQRELDTALHTQAQAGGSPAAAPPLGAILVGQGKAEPAIVEAALTKQKQTGEPKPAESRSIRVDADKLDLLINLVGELIIVGASANLIARQVRNSELLECTSMLSDLVEQVRDSALQLRMVKIGATFNRFQRVVHDVAREIGKDIGLAVSGEDTELDKTVVEKIGDPLTHLVRNAIDHGIEAAELRAQRGKPLRGTVRLNAFHDSGSIVIEVSDDGGGLDRERILAKAIERGLVDPERKLSDQEIYGLIFEPGFSTAAAITNLSGRGVGMDVVKKNITALRGTVTVDSAPGLGTTVTVRLPLTLAIIDGFLVGLGNSTFVVPLDMIDECIEFAAEPGHDYTNLRGQVLPFIRLRALFGVTTPPPRRESIVVVKHAGQRVGLVVDALQGEFQTVIKPLGRMFSQLRCISGSTILGSGDVALILDVPAIVSSGSGNGGGPGPVGEPPQLAA